MKDERQKTYEIILTCHADVYDSLGLQYLRTILTDKEEALIKAFTFAFS